MVVALKLHITFEEALQFCGDGSCEACGRNDVPFAIDHDHATGLVRGRLCYGCNSIFTEKETPETLRARATRYLAIARYAELVAARGNRFRYPEPPPRVVSPGPTWDDLDLQPTF